MTDHRQFMSCLLPISGLLKAYLLSATRNSADADDLIQQVSSVLWEKFSTYDPALPFRAWALGIARFEVLKWKQAQARSRIVLSNEALDSLSSTATEIADEVDSRSVHLADCLKKLPPPMRQAMLLRYKDGLAVANVALQLKKKIGAVEMLLVRTRRALRECVDRQLAREAAQ